MLTSQAPTRPASPPAPTSNSRSLQHALSAAGDDKISKIIAVVDRVGDAEVNRALLDPVRGRLAALRPMRPLRFSRLLFLPLDPLIVPPRNWRPTDHRVPRTVIGPVSQMVQAALGPPGLFVAQAIAHQTAAAADAIDRAGEVLWPLAADILAAAAPPASWAETALPTNVFRPLMAAIATVLRRAAKLRRLQQDAETGIGGRDEALIDGIMAGLAAEPQMGAAMVAQLILVQAPHTSPLLRSYVSSKRDTAEAVALNKAVAQGIEETLAYLESDTDFAGKVEATALRSAAEQIRLAASVLMAIDGDIAAPRYRARVRALKDRLDQTSRARFSKGIRECFTDRFAVAGQPKSEPEQELEQRHFEASARELRMLEASARQFSDVASYDRQLAQVAELVQTGLKTGSTTKVRACRLIEILRGPEAAAALYNGETRQAATARS